ncbi:hypothetical protein REPUB_Repub13aG0246200 [Reevesia pubescens]
MAAANWVCIAILVSLCSGMCYGNRVGLSTMDKLAKELVNSNQGNNISNSMQEVGNSSSSGSVDVDIVAGRDDFFGGPSCGSGDVDCVCIYNDCGNGYEDFDICAIMQSLSEHADKVKGITKLILDFKCSGKNNMNKDAMAPGSG